MEIIEEVEEAEEVKVGILVVSLLLGERFRLT